MIILDCRAIDDDDINGNLILKVSLINIFRYEGVFTEF